MPTISKAEATKKGIPKKLRVFARKDPLVNPACWIHKK